MKEAQYKELVDAAANYILTDGQNDIGLMSNSWVFSQISAASGRPLEGLASGWETGVILDIIDSLTYNAGTANVEDTRPYGISVFESLRRIAMSNPASTDHGGKEICVVRGLEDKYIGRSLVVEHGLSMTAEQVALSQALSRGDKYITHIATFDDVGRVVVPCGASLDLMGQIGLRETWVAVDYSRWLPMRKVWEYVDIHRTRD